MSKNEKPIKGIEIPSSIETNKEKVEEDEKQMIKIDQPFLTKKFLLWDVLVKPEELKKSEPLMFYITEENNMYPYKKVKPGFLQPKDQYNKKKEGVINEIHTRKLLTFHYGGEKIRTYVHYEKERYSYPHEPVQDAKRTATVIKNIQTNYKTYDEKTNILSGWQMTDVKKALWIIGGVIGLAIGAIFIGNVLGVWETLGWTGAEPVAKAVVQNITDVTKIITNGTIIR